VKAISENSPLCEEQRRSAAFFHSWDIRVKELMLRIDKLEEQRCADAK
jgi:hypothetical protein